MVFRSHNAVHRERRNTPLGRSDPRRRDVEGVEESLAPGGCNRDRPALRRALYPRERDEPIEQSSPGSTGKMVASLTPVEAVADSGPWWQCNAKVGEEAHALCGESV